MAEGPTIVERFLRGSTVAGERAVAWIRLGLSALVLLQLMLAEDSYQGLVSLDPRAWGQCTGLLLAMAFSVWTLRAVRIESSSRFLPELSAAVDALLVLGTLAPGVLWARPEWTGFTARPSWAFLALAQVTAGFRLSRGAVLLSAAISGPGFFGLMGLDELLNGEGLHVQPGDRVMAAIVWIGAVGASWGITRRTRSLVETGAQEARQAERARQRLGVYVSQEVADAALQVELLRPGGERRQVAVLFSDLRGFTGYGEHLAPERLIDELNAYLDAMVKVIREEGGVVDKYIGDAIMVVFGIPTPRPDDPLRAVRCARRMQAALAAHNAEREHKGLRPLQHGIGVHYGPVIAGNVGTRDRLQYTVVGDVVNTASRLEGATKELGIAVLVSEDVVDAAVIGADGLGLAPAGQLPIRGRSEPITVYGLADGEGAYGSRASGSRMGT